VIVHRTRPNRAADYDHLQVGQPSSRPKDLPEHCVQFLRREMPPLIRRSLEAELEKHMTGVEESLLERLHDIMQTSWLNLLSTYAAIAPPDPALAANPQPPQPEVPLLSSVELDVGFPENMGFAGDFDFEALMNDQLGTSGQLSLESSTTGSISADSLYASYTSNTSIEFEAPVSPSEMLVLGFGDVVSVDLKNSAPEPSPDEVAD
jgi:hypothetical protein